MSRRYWYGYISPGNIFDPASYILLPNQRVTCTTGTVLCSVYAQGGDSNPIFGTNLNQYITNSTTSNTAQPLGSTQKFLYKRTN